MICVCESTND